MLPNTIKLSFLIDFNLYLNLDKNDLCQHYNTQSKLQHQYLSFALDLYTICWWQSPQSSTTYKQVVKKYKPPSDLTICKQMTINFVHLSFTINPYFSYTTWSNLFREFEYNKNISMFFLSYVLENWKEYYYQKCQTNHSDLN